MTSAKIITVSSSKGGAGKTTTLMCLADYWSQQGRKVALMDTDPNKSLSRWYEKGRQKGFYQGIEFVQQLDDKEIISTAKALIARADLLMIDVAGIASVSLLKAAGIADLVIIPAQPSEDDFLEAINTMRIVREAEELTNRKIPFRTVLTRAKQGTRVLDHTLLQLEKLKFPVFKTVIFDRTVYAQSRFNGATPVTQGTLANGVLEIEALANEVDALLALHIPGAEEGRGVKAA
ncbi:MAG: ParA family protein [Alphaproteobacteria bacterium]|nr:ParA family protein [Alphaproteobacteria bacterium]MBP7904487.1 ParA family protein [Alphaproteobacteria bacterium]